MAVGQRGEHGELRAARAWTWSVTDGIQSGPRTRGTKVAPGWPGAIGSVAQRATTGWGHDEHGGRAVQLPRGARPRRAARSSASPLPTELSLEDDPVDRAVVGGIREPVLKISRQAAKAPRG